MNRFAFSFWVAYIALTGRDHRPTSGVAAGTWLCEVDYPTGGHFEGRAVHDSQGRYSCNATITSSNEVKTFTIQGTMLVRDGFLIDTCTNHTATNAPIPFTSRARIIKQSDREIVARWEGMQYDTTMRRVN
jgi:hypothetical protein